MNRNSMILGLAVAAAAVAGCSSYHAQYTQPNNSGYPNTENTAYNPGEMSNYPGGIASQSTGRQFESQNEMGMNQGREEGQSQASVPNQQPYQQGQQNYQQGSQQGGQGFASAPAQNQGQYQPSGQNQSQYGQQNSAAPNQGRPYQAGASFQGGSPNGTIGNSPSQPNYGPSGQGSQQPNGPGQQSAPYSPQSQANPPLYSPAEQGGTSPAGVMNPTGTTSSVNPGQTNLMNPYATGAPVSQPPANLGGQPVPPTAENSQGVSGNMVAANPSGQNSVENNGSAMSSQETQGNSGSNTANSENGSANIPANGSNVGLEPQLGGLNEKQNAAQSLTASDQQFVKDAHAGNTFEIAEGNKALTKAQNPAVKEIAQRMVNDHTKLDKQLTAIANRNGQTQLGGMTAQQIDQLAQLDKASGAEFDQGYLQQQKAAHEQTIADFKKEAQNADNPELKQWAQATIPALQEHLDLVNQQLNPTVGSER